MLHYAVLSGQTENVEKLLKHGMRVQHQSTADGATPLHRAAQTGNIKIATLLLDHGADLNPTNYLGQTPLDLAIKFKNKEFAKFICTKGGCKKHADTSDQNKNKNNNNNSKKRRNRRRLNKDTIQTLTPSNNINIESMDQEEVQDHLVVESECESRRINMKNEPVLICKDFSQIQTGRHKLNNNLK